MAEAAKVLGIPPGTVESRVFYGLRALRKVMEERDDTRVLLAAAQFSMMASLPYSVGIPRQIDVGPTGNAT